MIPAMAFSPVVLLTPSMAAAVELPRRLAASGRAVAGLYPLTPLELARAVAEPALLASGRHAWDYGHATLLAARLLGAPGAPALGSGLPRSAVAGALARTFHALRRGGVVPDELTAMAGPPAETAEDAARLEAVATLYRDWHAALEQSFADPVALFAAARDRLAATTWLEGASILVPDDLEPDAVEERFLEALAAHFPVTCIAGPRPPGLPGRTAQLSGVRSGSWAETPLAALAPEPAPPALARLGAALFEPPAGEPLEDASVELRTAAGEAEETRSVVRALLREARNGVTFQEMGVALARPEPYAALFTDLLERLGIPFRLHPSLPLRQGRCARSLLLLLRCRDLQRAAVMEFLTFAPVPFEELLGGGEEVRPAHWDELSREAGIVSGLDRWMIGLRTFAAHERSSSDRDPGRRERRTARADEAEFRLLRIVELLSATLDGLAGHASWREWSERLHGVVEQWIGPDRDREALIGVIADLAGLASAGGGSAAWHEVETVLESRLEWERLPLLPAEGGALHVGALDAIAGLRFRVLAFPGLVEGGYPGVLRPDPFLLDHERERLARRTGATPAARTGKRRGQLSLFDALETESGQGGSVRVPTTQDRLLEARRSFVRAIGQATRKLILSYPRADPRSGRERLPSLFFVAAASACAGRPLGAAELAERVLEDEPDTLPLEEALDRAERDRLRVRHDGEAAALAIAGASPFFRRSHLASIGRWSNRMTPYDGLVAPLPDVLRQKLDPITARAPLSASRIATFARCGFQYLLEHVLRLEPALEPEERKRLEPLERGSLFHEVAEAFLRARRDAGELPVTDSEERREQLLEEADRRLDELVAGHPPRYGLLWRRERERFKESLLQWLKREAGMAHRSTPAHFEVGFGPSVPPTPGEPHRSEPLAIDLGEGRILRLSGKIDRIDRRRDGGLVLRDYKTGRAPKDDGGVFRGGRQLQIPFYILAAAELFPGEPVVDAFLDYVDGGRQVAFDPASATSPAFRELLCLLVEAIAGGVFLQEPAACDFCDFTAVCGPRPLLERRRQIKLGDPRVQHVLRLRNFS
jgi:RecB family exonuclease